MTILGFVLYGSIVIVPLWLQTLLGYPAIQAGLTMAPRGLGSMLGMPIVGTILPKFDSRKLLSAGLALGALSTYQLSQLNLNVGYWDLFWPQFLQGFGLSLIFDNYWELFGWLIKQGKKAFADVKVYDIPETDEA